PKDKMSNSGIGEQPKTSGTEFQTVFEFNNGKAKVKKDRKYGFIDTLNNIIIPISFDEIRGFNKGLAPAKSGSKWGYINETGVFVIRPKFSEADPFDDRGLASVMIREKWGVIDTSGNAIIPIKFDRNFSTPVLPSLIVVSKSKGPLGLSEVYG